MSVEFRGQQFVKFWELGAYDAQTTFIAAHVSEKLKVCRAMFVRTLSISTKRVDTALKKVRSDSVIDKRGKKQDKQTLQEERNRHIDIGEEARRLMRN
ncbi:hypothetical protein PR048_028874 [Dryococelus australis]|uniref:Uncharacterized protein n=1 Tax=Dryococelus australis TaxID=614101 RepID=A0ABQ9GBS6_9NEOP|nr:hypothetical protein PR048_028874 [Dryococelus australis]